MPRYSDHYLAQLLAQRDYLALVDLQGVASGWEGFDKNLPSFGWPCPIFVVFELVTWLAQADRSGVWTYYEATPVARSDCVLTTLDSLGAVEFHQQYARGKERWQNYEESEKLDKWIRENEQTLIDWAFTVLIDHPAELASVCD
ncbi:hypothetical protein [Duganella vulcania]|uniref:DUF4375 domain-containing protein n=1 Tax=Duganella vulcania TaxID=2692166 RepID=A0A845GT09_9BURK|nr:hypothetical protein [Duganella vulcania]MYM96366.1 hypothetical protein [Duganella vulcania]